MSVYVLYPRAKHLTSYCLGVAALASPPTLPARCRMEASRADSATRTIYLSNCVQVTFSKVSGRQRPLLRIDALEKAISISEEDVAEVLSATETLLQRKEMFETCWDLRHCPVPSVAIVATCVRWSLTNKPSLDKLNTRLCVVVPNGRLLSRLVSTILSTFSPTCETLVCSDAAEADVFLRGHESAAPRPPKHWSKSVSQPPNDKTVTT